VPSATNWGLELEWNLTGGAMADWLRGRSLAKESKSTEEFFWDRQSTAFWGAFLRDISTTGNLSWIQSQIDYGSMSKGNNTSSVRPLQGQSPWVINLGLSYKNSASWSQVVRSDTSVSLSYNVFGPRLKRIGTGTLLDSYEQPFHQLDLVVKHRFDETWSLDFKAKNLFDLPLVETAGDLILSSQQKGRTFSIGGKYDF
jgi:outer membrane receptor protein involved in Fe transport